MLLSDRHIFPIRTKLSIPKDNFFWRGGGSCPYLVPRRHCVVERYVAALLPETPGTRVPVQIPDGYPGTKIPESPSTNVHDV